jgi:hypothetical protein
MKTAVRIAVVALCTFALSSLAFADDSAKAAKIKKDEPAAAKVQPAGKGQAAAKLAPTKEQQAQQMAEAWLKLVDAGQYDKSHDAAAKLFRDAVAKEMWAQQVKAVREPLGALKLRRFKTATYSTTLPGAPDGEYVVIQFETSFANKKDAVETVTPMLDADGKWHVSGYFIK